MNPVPKSEHDGKTADTRKLFEAPSLLPGFCICCRSTQGLSKHHPALRSRGGTDGPELHLCVNCHTDAHNDRLPLRYNWVWLLWQRQTAGGYWVPCRDR